MDAIPEDTLNNVLGSKPEGQLNNVFESKPEGPLHHVLESNPEVPIHNVLESKPEGPIHNVLELIPEVPLNNLSESKPECSSNKELELKEAEVSSVTNTDMSKPTMSYAQHITEAMVNSPDGIYHLTHKLESKSEGSLHNVFELTPADPINNVFKSKPKGQPRLHFPS